MRNTAYNSVYVAIASELVNRRSVQLINFYGDGKVITLKSATALILDHYPITPTIHPDLARGTESLRPHVEPGFFPPLPNRQWCGLL